MGGEPASKRRRTDPPAKANAKAKADPPAGPPSTMPMPRVGFGTFKLKGDACVTAVRHALASGYRLIDTAQVYENEKDVGRALKESGVKREEVYITTKVWRSQHGYERCTKSLRKSLRALGVDYIDMVLVHWPGCKTGWPLKRGTTCPPNWTPAMRDDTWRALEDLVNEGKIRHIGVSNYSVRHLKHLLAVAKVPPHAVQCECHPLLAQKPLREFCAEHGIVFQASSSLGSGESAKGHAEVMALDAVVAAAAAHDVTPAQVLLKWSLQHGCHVVPKSAQAGRIETNRDLDGFELTSEEMAAIDACDRGEHLTWKGLDPDSVE